MIIVGIDEVGRGCWAGPLVAGAVVLHSPVVGLKDSKKLSKLQRERLYVQITANAEVGLGWVWPEEIDAHGITWAVRTAMQRALEQITIDYDQVFIDGNINYLAENSRATALIKADDSIPAVSAASIAAKVARDTYMANLDESYANYDFGSHVGYGTKAHIAALAAHGVCDIHRKSYKPIKALLI